MKRRRGSIALRLLALGVLQVALIVLVGDWLIRQNAPPRAATIVTSLFVEVVAEQVDAPDIEGRLRALHEKYEIESTLYRDGATEPFASATAKPLPFPKPAGMPHHENFRLDSATFARGGHDYTLVFGVRRSPRFMPPPLTNFLTGVVVVALGAFGIARWVVRPLQEIARAAHALGTGDMRARASLARTDELGELGRTFNEMAERIEQLMMAEKELLANVSHELRTPLARIRVALDLAAEGDAEAARTSLDEIRIDLAELEKLIDDILTTIRFELGAAAAKLPLHLEASRPNELVSKAAERFRIRHPRRPLTVDASDDLPLVYADVLLLRRVIDNLLENAHKYSPDPEAKITLRATVDATGGGDVLFEVEDHGVGIPDEDLPNVFTAFFRGERSRSRGTGGVGLGLTLAKRITEAHGGRIGVTSSKSGSNFCVRVPQLEARDAVADATQQSETKA